MENLFITDLTIDKVRHLEDIHIPLSQDQMKHLIFTGKNGSGKTSVLDALAGYLNEVSASLSVVINKEDIEMMENAYGAELQKNNEDSGIIEIKKRIENNRKLIKEATHGLSLKLNYSLTDIFTMFQQGDFIIAYYKADRVFRAEIPNHVEKVELQDKYTITDTPREEFVKYLLDLKMTEALAATAGKKDKAKKIERWFGKFENLLQRIFEEPSLRLEFDEDTFRFNICMSEREPFDFNTLSSGYAAVLDILVDIVIRMEKRTNKTFDFSMPGIVLIDEIETHLHLDLQKKILDLLTTVFPKIQFIVTTHSPFILNSLENVVVYDLENHILVEDGLANVPYDGIVEGYFKADTMSSLLKDKYERYKVLVCRENLSDEEFEEIAKLELFLDEIPDYLALDITTEYKRLKLDFENREDL